ncbi:MAG: diguanylate cyclase [bacterium]
MNDDIKSLREQLDVLKEKFTEIEQANEKLRQQLAEADALYAITATLSATLDFEEVLRFVKKTLTSSFEIDHYELMLFRENFKLQAGRNYHDLGIAWTDAAKCAQSSDVFAQACSQKSNVYVENTNAIKLNPTPNSTLTPDAAAFLCLPLINENGIILGLLNLYRKGKSSFSAQDIELFRKTSEQLSFAIDKAVLYEHTKELSITDELTGIFNRRYFNQRFERELQRSKRYNHSLAVLMLDIDHFKNYNDLNGHIMGDQVLKKVAVTLESNLRKADILARYGGEEFVILLPEISKTQARKVAQKLRKKIEKATFENEAAQPNKSLTISLGFAVFPEDSQNPQDLICYADDALYQAKASGRNCVFCHDSESSESSSQSMAQEKNSDFLQ